MIDGKFDVVFRGQIVKSFTPEVVRSNLVSLFKSSPDAIERLFSGAETTIRKGLDYSAAMKYQAALKNAGALALIKEVVAESEEAPKAPVNRPRANFSSPPASSQQPTASSEQHNAAGESHPVTSVQAENKSQESATTDGLSLAAAGAQILPDKVYEKREVDTSELSLAAPGERLLPKKPPEKPLALNIDHLAITNDTTPIGGD